MAKKRAQPKRNQAWVKLDWTPIPRSETGGVWITLRKDGKKVGLFQISQGAVYFFPKSAKTKICKRITFEKLATLFKKYGQDYAV